MLSTSEVIFLGGSNNTIFDVPVLIPIDQIIENSETLVLQLTSSQPDVVVGVSQATVTIEDRDSMFFYLPCIL